jgi:drug/metabolite transporter (DMT)-like permease
MGIFLAPRMGRALWQTGHPGLQLARGIVLSGFTLCFFTALFRLPQAEATAINFIAPFIVMLLAGPLLGETVGWPRWCGAGLGFIGMLAIVRPGNPLDPIGVLFVLLTVVCNVGFQLLTRKLAVLERSVPTIFVSALIGVMLSVLTLPLQEIWGGWPSQVNAQQRALLLSLGLTGALGQWFFIRAYYWSSASFIAPLVFLQVVWAVVSGWLFFAQFPDSISLSGMLIILVAGALSMWSDKGRRRVPIIIDKDAEREE